MKTKILTIAALLLAPACGRPSAHDPSGKSRDGFFYVQAGLAEQDGFDWAVEGEIGSSGWAFEDAVRVFEGEAMVPERCYDLSELPPDFVPYGVDIGPRIAVDGNAVDRQSDPNLGAAYLANISSAWPAGSPLTVDLPDLSFTTTKRLPAFFTTTSFSSSASFSLSTGITANWIPDDVDVHVFFVSDSTQTIACYTKAKGSFRIDGDWLARFAPGTLQVNVVSYATDRQVIDGRIMTVAMASASRDLQVNVTP